MKKMEQMNDNGNEGVLVYVKFDYKENDKYVYSLFFSNTPDDVWGFHWDSISPSSNGDISPDETTYNKVYKIKSIYPLVTLEDTSCYTMEFATYGILALSWIDISNLEEYPEQGRMTLHFGDNKEKVISVIKPFDITLI